MLDEHAFRGASILAADDDPSNLQVLESMLRELGCEVRLAIDGEMLLKSVAVKLPDLILLDVHMPGMDGYQACRKLKEEEKTRDIPIIFVSAMHEEFSKIKGFELGAVDYITKPFQLEELKARIGVHLKLAQQARELRNLKEAVEQSRTSIFITDLQGLIEYANQSTAEVTGYEMSEIIGENPRIFKSDVHPDSVYTELWETVARGEVWRGELCNCKKDGSLYWALVIISPVRGVDGSFTRYVAVEEDITEQRLLREQLIQAKEQAEAANKAKSSFLAMMSHEIRTPMNGVVGMIDLLNQTALDEEQKRLARIARVSSMSLMNIINDILDFSKIEAGRMQLESIPVSWRSLIDSVAEMVSSSLLDKDLKLYCLVDPAIPNRVLGDQERLRQLLLNLLSNAIKFTDTTDEKQGQVLIRLTHEPEGKQRLVLEVEDNGIGISESQLEKLFQPFVQADNSTHRRYGGTGLGLSICVRLVSLMNGEISCVSEKGQGARFIVALPCLEAKHEEKRVPLLKGFRLLLVSNNCLIRDYLQLDLEETGAEIFVADEQGPVGGGREPLIDLLLIAGDWEPAEKRHQVQMYRRKYTQARCVVLISIAEQNGQEGLVDCILVDANPFRPEAIYKALGIASGQKSPEPEQQEFLVGDSDSVPTSDQAEAEGRLILVAEDNHVNQEVIQRQLNLLGYAAELADNGKVALEKMEHRQYGLLLTDCHMPKMDGFELTSAVREREQRGAARIPIVAITANAMQGEDQRCMLAGMDGYLAKPVELVKLKEILEHWLPTGSDTIRGDKTQADDFHESQEEVIDRQLISRFLGDNRQIQHYFLLKFSDESGEIFDSACSAVEARNWSLAAELMHKLKSSSKAIGAVTLSELCIELEKAAKDKDVERATCLSASVSKEFQRVVDYVATLPE